MTDLPFSITAHGQDFMADLGSDDLLREICAAAEFVAVETEYSRGLMMERCPDSAAKIHRVYNGMDLGNFLHEAPHAGQSGTVEILSIGRLVAFKGFEYLIEACEQLRQRNVQFHCEIVGDGPLRERLQQQNARSGPHSSYEKIARPVCLREGSRKGGVDEDVGINGVHAARRA